MRPAALLVPLASVLLGLLAGCGDDGGATPQLDAPEAADAPPAANVATKLAKACASPAECPPEAPRCIKLSPTAASGFCSLDCGSNTTVDMAPAGGTALCEAQYDGTSGTPICGANDSTNDVCPGGTCTWVCVVACGVLDAQDFGTCPNDLACTGNACN